MDFVCVNMYVRMHVISNSIKVLYRCALIMVTNFYYELIYIYIYIYKFNWRLKLLFMLICFVYWFSYLFLFNIFYLILLLLLVLYYFIVVFCYKTDFSAFCIAIARKRCVILIHYSYNVKFLKFLCIKEFLLKYL
jgi:hypothetical protein